MNHTHLVTVSAALALGLAAQPTGPAKSTTPSHTISVDFRGGTLADYVRALREAGPTVNIVAPESAARVKLPPIVLRETSIEAALRAATFVVEPGTALGINVSVGSLPNVGPIGEPVFSVAVQQNNATGPAVGPAGMASPQAVRVFSLRGLVPPAGAAADGVSYLEVKTILTAIDTGLGVAATQEQEQTGASDKAVLRLHEDSGLLFVAGNIAQLRLVEEVLSNLSHEVRAARQTKDRGDARAVSPDEDDHGKTDKDGAPKKKAVAR